MSEWSENHREAMEIADLAHSALNQGNDGYARKLFALAAESEEKALAALDPLDPSLKRTARITRESLAALREKAGL
jgi:hypothetical protein